jgi:hypothetical protein
MEYMSGESPNVLSVKQLAKYQRQQCINLLEKMTKYLFRMFRAKQLTEEEIEKRFFILYDKLIQFKSTDLYAIYHREMRQYVDQVANIFRGNWNLTDIADDHMSRLNRLQKLKNASKYKKEKHTKKFG